MIRRASPAPHPRIANAALLFGPPTPTDPNPQVYALKYMPKSRASQHEILMLHYCTQVRERPACCPATVASPSGPLLTPPSCPPLRNRFAVAQRAPAAVTHLIAVYENDLFFSDRREKVQDDAPGVCSPARPDSPSVNLTPPPVACPSRCGTTSFSWTTWKAATFSTTAPPWRSNTRSAP